MFLTVWAYSRIRRGALKFHCIELYLIFVFFELHLAGLIKSVKLNLERLYIFVDLTVLFYYH